MRVRDVRTVLVTAPWGGDPAFGGGEFTRSSAFIVVATDEGLDGVGEALLGYFAPESVAPLAAWFGELLADPDLGLDPLEPARTTAELAQRARWWGRTGAAMSVLSAIEMALWDIAGKAAGRPVHALLGGAHHDRLPAYASGGTGAWPVERTVEQAERYVAAGFRAVKLGTGLDGRPGGFTTQRGAPPYGTWYAGSTALRVADERAKLEALRRALGDAIELALDAHAVQVREPWSRGTALDLALAVEPYDLLFLEEPLRYDDPGGYAEIRARTRVPIAGGECLVEEEFHGWLAAGALDIVQPDASWAGGIGAVRRVADRAAASGAGLIVHTGGSIGPGFMANAHAAFASPNARWIELAPATAGLRAALLAEAPRLVDGFLERPTAPGLGVVLDPAFVAAHPFRPGFHEFA